MISKILPEASLALVVDVVSKPSTQDVVHLHVASFVVARREVWQLAVEARQVKLCLVSSVNPASYQSPCHMSSQWSAGSISMSSFCRDSLMQV